MTRLAISPHIITKDNTAGGAKGNGWTLVRYKTNARKEGPIEIYIYSLNNGDYGYKNFVVFLSYICTELLKVVNSTPSDHPTPLETHKKLEIFN